MQIGDLVTVQTFGIGVIVEVDAKLSRPMFKVAFFNEFLDEWFFAGYLDKLEVISESR